MTQRPERARQRGRLTRDWAQAIAKVEAEGICRNCGTPHNLETCHLAGREYDLRAPVGWAYEWKRPVLVVPSRVIPLCGPATDTGTCHNLLDTGQLDLLPKLSDGEQVQLVADLGLELARQRVCPSDYRPEIEAARRQQHTREAA